MRATCSYPDKSTWLKAIKKGNLTGGPIINEGETNTAAVPNSDGGNI